MVQLRERLYETREGEKIKYLGERRSCGKCCRVELQWPNEQE